MQEPWLLFDFDEDFYGEELRLVIVGYIRAEVFSKMTIFHFHHILNHKSAFCDSANSWDYNTTG